MSKTHAPLSQIDDNPHQPRMSVGDVDALADTILEYGLRQLPEARLVIEETPNDGPVKNLTPHTKRDDGAWQVKPDDRLRVQIASGHRRVEAVRQLNLDDTVTDQDLRDAGLRPGSVPVDLQHLTDAQMLDLLTIENAQREELSPIEQARLIGAAMEEGRDATEIAERFGKSPSWVSNRKRLTTLPMYVQEHVHEGEISVRQGMALAFAESVWEEAKEVFENPQGINHDLQPGTMAQQAKEDGLPSGHIRDRARELADLVERVEEVEGDQEPATALDVEQTDQTDDDRPDGEETETDHDGDDVGAPQEGAAGAGDGGPGEVVSGHDEDVQGSQAGDDPEERDGAAGAAGRPAGRSLSRATGCCDTAPPRRTARSG